MMQNLFFPKCKDLEEDVCQADLKSKFESLGIKPEKAQMLARFIVEPKLGGEVVINDFANCAKKEAIDVLYDLIGPYKVYSQTESGVDYASDTAMRKKVCDKFGRKLVTLQEALSCEDF